MGCNNTQMDRLAGYLYCFVGQVQVTKMYYIEDCTGHGLISINYLPKISMYIHLPRE